MNTIQSTKGFSLLEIMIAVAIMATSFVILLSSQGDSFLTSERSELLSEATMLAQKKMVETEMELEKDLAKNKFPSDDKEEKGAFDEPYEDFRWKVTLKKVEIPVMKGGGGEDQVVLVENYIKNITKEISKRVREVQLTVYWGDSEKPEEEQQQMTVTTHIVKLN